MGLTTRKRSHRAAKNGASAHGSLLIIGGHEDKEGERLLLRTLVERAGGGPLVVCTAASNAPDEVWEDYAPVFRDLGASEVRHLHADTREEAADPGRHRLLDDAAAIFFTGGDQLKLTSQLGDTPVYQKTRELFVQGGCVAGTSAGASVVCETMLVTGEQDSSPRVRDSLRMAPGFGFLRGALVDQHFAERGRIGRLIGVVAQNPRIIGIGIDEDTAILVQGREFLVLGAGGVYVLDGQGVTHSNLTEDSADRTLSVFDLRLHLLNMGDRFNLEARTPNAGATDRAEEAVMGGAAGPS